MSPNPIDPIDPIDPNQRNTHSEPAAEIAFVRQALADADRSERSSRIIVGVLAIIALAIFVWMHMNMFNPQNLGQLLNTLLRVDLFNVVFLFAVAMYLRLAMNRNTRTILRSLANTRQR